MNDPADNPPSDPQRAPDDPPALRRVVLVVASPAGVSLALAWKNARPDLTVTGHGAGHSVEAAEAAGALDRKAATPETAVQDADLMLLAGRLPAALRHLEELAPHVEPDTLVTDTGAVKRPITRHAAEVLPDEVAFVGGHPVPAAKREAPARADATRFDGGTYFLCPPEASGGEDALRERHPAFHALAEDTGADVHVLPATRHDRLAATARDLPALLSAALARVASEEGDHPALHALIPPPYRPLVWGRGALTDEEREELTGNEGPLLDALGRYARKLQEARRHLAAGDLDAALGVEERPRSPHHERGGAGENHGA